MTQSQGSSCTFIIGSSTCIDQAANMREFCRLASFRNYSAQGGAGTLPRAAAAAWATPSAARQQLALPAALWRHAANAVAVALMSGQQAAVAAAEGPGPPGSRRPPAPLPASHRQEAPAAAGRRQVSAAAAEAAAAAAAVAGAAKVVRPLQLLTAEVAAAAATPGMSHHRPACSRAHSHIRIPPTMYAMPSNVHATHVSPKSWQACSSAFFIHLHRLQASRPPNATRCPPGLPELCQRPGLVGGGVGGGRRLPAVGVRHVEALAQQRRGAPLRHPPPRPPRALCRNSGSSFSTRSLGRHPMYTNEHNRETWCEQRWWEI